MQGMTTQERIEDISKISGLSEDIVRRVMNAEKESITKSLRKGERANLIGRVVIRPEIRQKLLVGGEFEGYIKLYASVAASLESALSDLTGFEVNTNIQNEPGIRLTQIDALT